MSNQPITPPVLPTQVDLPAVVANDLTLLQKLAASDKSGAIASLIHGGVLITASFGLHLTADQVAVLGTIDTALVGYFLSLKINAK